MNAIDYHQVAKARLASWRLRGLCFLLLMGCRGTLSPLSNKLEIGQESYFVFVADGEEGLGDLFAAAPVGGEAYQVTFTRVAEHDPALSPDGVVLAFLRRHHRDTTRSQAVFINLASGTERAVDDSIDVEAIAWSRDGRQLYLRTASTMLAVDAPPAVAAPAAVPEAQRPRADSAFMVLLGDPAVGEAIPCEGGGLCARLASGVTVLAAEGHSAAQWGSDSLVYSSGTELVIRPLGGGATRRIRFARSPKNPRQVTLFVSR